MPVLDKDRIPEKAKVRKTPLWKGPSEEGISFSLLSRYLACKERFRVLVVEGLKPKEGFNHRLEYGNMWHLCEETYLSGGSWDHNLSFYFDQLRTKFPFQRDDVRKWYNVCRTQFPIYLQHYNSQPKITPVLQEYPFKIPFLLPSGRKVILMGKWDSADHEKHRVEGLLLWCQENKTKGDVNQQQVTRQLTFDLQTMIYIVAMRECRRIIRDKPKGIYEEFGSYNPNLSQEVIKGKLAGVRYNVIRRPLSWGEDSIKQHQPSKRNPKGESEEEFYTRLGGLISSKPEKYFFRWSVDVSENDTIKFLLQCLYPVLENLLDDFEWWQNCKCYRKDVYNYRQREEEFNHYQRHFRAPYGVFDPTKEGRIGDLDTYLDTGNEMGLERVTNLFPELQPT